jgi:hypothetical protein
MLPLFRSFLIALRQKRRMVFVDTTIVNRRAAGINSGFAAFL